MNFQEIYQSSKDKIKGIMNEKVKPMIAGLHTKKEFNGKLHKMYVHKIPGGEQIKNKLTLLGDKYIKQARWKEIAFCGIGVVLALCVGLAIMPKKDHETTVAVTARVTDNAAEQYFYSGDYEKAIAEYLKIIQQDDKDPLWDMKISEVYSVMGNTDDSKKYIETAKALRNKNLQENTVKTDKDIQNADMEVLNYIVFTELMNKDYKDALKDGEDALSKYAESKKLIKTMISVYMANSDMEKAKALIGKYPVEYNSAYDLAEYARLKMLVEDWDNGFEYLRAAWKIDKDEYKVFDVLAQIAAYNKDNLLEKITALSAKSPEDPSYKMWLAKIYSMREETSEQSKKLLEEVNGQDVGNIEKLLIEAAVYQNTKQSDKSDAIIENLIKENGNDYRVLHTAGWYYLSKNDAAKALEYCQKSIIKNKNYPDNYGFLMPEILKAMGKGVEGEPYFRTALFKEPYNYNIMLTIANYYWQTTKNSDKALEYFKLAEIVKPNDGDIKYNMAMIYISSKKFDEAINILQKCIKMDDSVPKYHRTLGTIYLTQGKADEGIKETRYAYQADKEDILTLNNAGCYYITSGSDIDTFQRGEYNLRKACEGINASTDEFTKNTLQDNYNKAKKFLDDFSAGSGNEDIKVPDFVLFY